MIPRLPSNPNTITPILRISNKEEAENKYGCCPITEAKLNEALEDLKHLMDLDIYERRTDPDREEAKMVLASFMMHAAKVLEKDE